VKHRPYRDNDDYLRMRQFLQVGWRATGIDGGMYHAGELAWHLFMLGREVQNPAAVFALWEDDAGELIGYCEYYAKSREASLQIDPRLWGSGRWEEMADEMIAWAGERYADAPAGNGALSIYERETRTDVGDYLASRGFVRSDDPPMRFHRLSLASPPREPVLPDGFVVRAVRENEIEDRVAIHREVWHPSRVTLDGYRAMRTVPGYDPELDIVAVAPDGTIAAYAICWHDEVNRNGLFEPVGAREACRGRGLAKAVLLETLRRLRERGCEHAYVYTTEDREPACRLYLSAGFEIIGRWVGYRRA
jgi:mycothiol synthase